eukprot:312163-Prymnesium_polylepis.1
MSLEQFPKRRLRSVIARRVQQLPSANVTRPGSARILTGDFRPSLSRAATLPLMTTGGLSEKHSRNFLSTCHVNCALVCQSIRALTL